MIQPCFAGVCALILLVVGISSANADDMPQVKKITQTVKLYEGVLHFPPPPWVKDVKELGNSNFYRNQQNNRFTLEQIPKNQKFESWTQIYGVYGFHLPDYDMKRFIEESLNVMVLGCKAKAKFEVVSEDSAAIVVSYFCPDLQEPLAIDGNNAESGFLYMAKVKQSFAKLYMAWRSKGEFMETKEWPLNEETVSDAIDRMNAVRYVKAE